MYYEHTKIYENLKSGPVVWTSEKLTMLIRNASTSKWGQYKLKNRNEINEFLHLLNEEYICCEIMHYSINRDLKNRARMLEVEGESYFKGLTEEERIAFEQIDQTSTNSEEIQMKTAIWKKLIARGASKIEFKKRNYSMYAEHLKVYVKTGDANIKHILEAFQNGAKEYIIVPYTNETTGEMFILKATEKWTAHIEYLSKEKVKIHEFYSCESGMKSNSLLSNVEGKDYKDGDLIIFREGKKSLRGILLTSLLPGKADITHAKVLYEQEVKYSEERLNATINNGTIKNHKDKYKWSLSEEGYEQTTLLIKCPKKTLSGTEFEFLAVKPEQILKIAPIDLDSIFERVIKCLDCSLSPGLSLSFINDETSTNNAAYKPENHEIKVVYNNFFHLIVRQFIDDGILPEETIEIVIAHELGHADSKDDFNEEFSTIIERINELTMFIEANWKSVYFRDASKQEAETVYKKLQELLALRMEFKEMELLNEKNAYTNGVKYVSEELRKLFAKDNFELYKRYENFHNEQLNLIREKIYFLKDELPYYMSNPQSLSEILENMKFR